MNCKQGDLAVIVRSYAGNEGKMVECLRLVPEQENPMSEPGPVWLVNIELKGAWGDATPHIHDDQLRPIRDQDGQDETLTWLDVPSKEIA